MRAVQGGTLFLSGELFRSPGGIQRCNRDQLEALRRAEADSPLAIVALNDASLPWPGARACAGSRARFSWTALAAARKGRPRRVILGHRNFLPLVPGLRAASPDTVVWLLAYGREVERPFGWLERLCLRGVALGLAISPFTAARLSASGYRGPVELWPCSLAHELPLPEPRPPELGPCLRLLSVARLEAAEGYKGVDLAIEALALLGARGRRARLSVVGDGDQLPALRALAARLGVGEAVSFLGRLDDRALQAEYASCDLLVLPSAGEGFGVVFLEALAWGKPVVAADAGGTPFVVRPGLSGVLVPPGNASAVADAIAGLAQDPEGARALGLRGRAFLEAHFTFERLVARTRELLGG